VRVPLYVHAMPPLDICHTRERFTRYCAATRERAAVASQPFSDFRRFRHVDDAARCFALDAADDATK